MKNIVKAELLDDIRKFFKENNLNIESCGCCGGYHLTCKDEELSSGDNFNESVEEDIKYYKENAGKIYVNYYDNKFTNIEMIKVNDKIVNLGGRSYPFHKFMQHIERLHIL